MLIEQWKQLYTLNSTLTQKNYDAVVLTYAGGKTFDDQASTNINRILGEKNIINFHAKEDKIAEFMNMAEANIPLGTHITFSAQESQDYQNRVRNEAYTCLDPKIKPCIGMLQGPLGQMGLQFLGIVPDVVSFLDPSIWEAHQLPTYADLSGKAFSKVIKKGNK